MRGLCGGWRAAEAEARGPPLPCRIAEGRVAQSFCARRKLARARYSRLIIVVVSYREIVHHSHHRVDNRVALAFKTHCFARGSVLVGRKKLATETLLLDSPTWNTHLSA